MLTKLLASKWCSLITLPWDVHKSKHKAWNHQAKDTWLTSSSEGHVTRKYTWQFILFHCQQLAFFHSRINWSNPSKHHREMKTWHADVFGLESRDLKQFKHDSWTRNEEGLWIKNMCLAEKYDRIMNAKNEYESRICAWEKSMTGSGKECIVCDWCFACSHVMYSNRSAAHAHMRRFAKAKDSATQCVELAPDWWKGYVRLGQVCVCMCVCVWHNTYVCSWVCVYVYDMIHTCVVGCGGGDVCLVQAFRVMCATMFGVYACTCACTYTNQHTHTHTCSRKWKC
jgi:hypothetical protein